MPGRRRSGTAPMPSRAAQGLSFAAAPAFALMALLNAGLPPDMHASPLGGMVPMYTLMSAVHVVPRLRLIAGRTRAA